MLSIHIHTHSSYLSTSSWRQKNNVRKTTTKIYVWFHGSLGKSAAIALGPWAKSDAKREHSRFLFLFSYISEVVTDMSCARFKTTSCFPSSFFLCSCNFMAVRTRHLFIEIILILRIDTLLSDVTIFSYVKHDARISSVANEEEEEKREGWGRKCQAMMG